MTTAKDLVAKAGERVRKVAPGEAVEMIRKGGVLVVDVRDPTEVQKSGKVKGAVAHSRGMIEFRADPESPYHDPAFSKDKTVLVYCASGGRSALAGAALMDLGYRNVINAGGFKELTDAGAETEPVQP